MSTLGPLTAPEIDAFVRDGFVAVHRAFPRAVADQARQLLWTELESTVPGLDRRRRSTWTHPVVRLDGNGAPPFFRAVNAPRLTAALDQLVGPGRWQRQRGIGRFPIRFPTAEPADDGGWHIDASIPMGDTWYADICSTNRALLALFLLSDVPPDGGATELRVGSHLDVARLLAPLGARGMDHADVAERLPHLADRPTALAAGRAGDVFLCHPFLVHRSGWNRRGTPRFLSNCGIRSTGPLRLDPATEDVTPVERAVHLALGLAQDPALVGDDTGRPGAGEARR